MSSARKLFIAALALVAGCGDKTERTSTADPTPAPIARDAGVGVNAGPTITYDPTAGHLDEGPSTVSGTRPAARRTARPIDLVLRSSPSGARVFVDGEDKGITPVLWQGDTGEHVFTFVKKDHAMSRYRFWAITSGVVHGRLESVVEDVKGSNMTPPPELVPPQVAPPPTLVSPDASTPQVMAPHVIAPPIDATVAVPPPVVSPPAVVIDAAPAGSPVGPTPF